MRRAKITITISSRIVIHAINVIVNWRVVAAAGTIDVPAFAVVPLARTFWRIVALALGLCETGLLAERLGGLAAASVFGRLSSRLGSQSPGRFSGIIIRVDAHREFSGTVASGRGCWRRRRRERWRKCRRRRKRWRRRRCERWSKRHRRRRCRRRWRERRGERLADEATARAALEACRENVIVERTAI